MQELNTKLLVVDDDPIGLSMILIILDKIKKRGCDIYIAATGEEAIGIAQQQQLDVVLLDVNLPDINGFEVCRRIRSMGMNKNTLVLFLSGLEDLDSKLEGFRAGGVDYITKPYEKEEILIRVETQLSLRVLQKRVLKEKEKSDQLLLNILPIQVADELKKRGRVIPKHYKSACVLFSDFTDFTSIANTLSPEVLIKDLDFCFKKFDQLTTKWNVEKIKTIGDAYLCASGIPSISADYVQNIMGLAFDMQSFMKDERTKRLALGKDFFQMRIGIHAGPLVAGVVGVKKFAYDIWGDTVNIASRMESSGEVGRINISEDLFQLLKDPDDFVANGTFISKDKRTINMYLSY